MRSVVEAGVAVMGHVGLTPQSISVLGGFRPAAQSGAAWVCSGGLGVQAELDGRMLTSGAGWAAGLQLTMMPGA